MKGTPFSGPFRKGKSFLLDYMLRYLYANVRITIRRVFFKSHDLLLKFQYPSVSVPASNFKPNLNWIGGENEPLRGFSWRSGTKRDTTGIIVWSDVFLCDTMDGDNYAIVLMDTQGLFDRESTYQENTVVFSLSTLLSSLQILNLSKNIQENDLQNLQVNKF
jgi:atlastin